MGKPRLLSLPMLGRAAGALLSRRRLRDRATIFVLHRPLDAEHGIRGHDLDRVHTTLRALKSTGLPLVSVSDFVSHAEGKGRVPDGAIAFTIDDGYEDQATRIIPIFSDLSIPLSLFVITDFLDGKCIPWDLRIARAFALIRATKLAIPFGRTEIQYSWANDEEKIACRRNFQRICKALNTDNREDLISRLCSAAGLPSDCPIELAHAPVSWEALRRLESCISVGSHSASHIVFSQADTNEARHELTSSLSRLRTERVPLIPMVAWPVGRATDFSERDELLAADAGYRAALSVDESPVTLSRIALDSFRLSRMSLPHDPIAAILAATTMPNAGAKSSVGSRDGLLIRRTAWRKRVKQFARRSASVRLYSQLVEQREDLTVDLGRVRRVVFICKGNICRSPFAEGVALKYGVNAISAGLDALEGSPADSSAIRNSLLFNVRIENHSSRVAGVLHFTPVDLVVVMTSDQLSLARELCDTSLAQVALLGQFATGRFTEITDPFGGDDLVFLDAFQKIDSAVYGLSAALARESGISP